MTAAKVAIAAAVLTVFAAGCSTGGKSAAPPTSTPTPSSSATVDTTALRAWWDHGGDAITAALGADTEAVGNAADAGDASTLHDACTLFATDIGKAQQMPAPPIPSAGQSWSNAMDSYAAGAQQCLAAVASGTVDESKANLMAYSIQQGTTNLDVVSARLKGGA